VDLECDLHPTLLFISITGVVGCTGHPIDVFRCGSVDENSIFGSTRRETSEMTIEKGAFTGIA